MNPDRAQSGVHQPVLRTSGLRKQYPLRRSLLDVVRRREPEYVHAVKGVDLAIRHGEVLGLAGESGSGKTVTAEMIARLQPPTDGTIEFLGQDITSARGDELHDFRRRASMVFQDPYDSLNARTKVRDVVSEPLRIQRIGTRNEREQRVLNALEQVHLSPPEYYWDSYPHELSGGERQRVSVARALILDPILLIADEPTTMLDVSVRAGLLNLLKEMTEHLSLSMLFISHDFSTLSYLSDRIAIMYLGHVVERGPARSVLSERLHPYTQALESAIPRIDPDAQRQRVTTSIDTGAPSEHGCPFAPRCPERMPLCDDVMPPLLPVQDDHAVACHLYTEAGAATAVPGWAVNRRRGQLEIDTPTSARPVDRGAGGRPASGDAYATSEDDSDHANPEENEVAQRKANG